MSLDEVKMRVNAMLVGNYKLEGHEIIPYSEPNDLLVRDFNRRLKMGKGFAMSRIWNGDEVTLYVRNFKWYFKDSLNRIFYFDEAKNLANLVLSAILVRGPFCHVMILKDVISSPKLGDSHLRERVRFLSSLSFSKNVLVQRYYPPEIFSSVYKEYWDGVLFQPLNMKFDTKYVRHYGFSCFNQEKIFSFLQEICTGDKRESVRVCNNIVYTSTYFPKLTVKKTYVENGRKYCVLTLP